MSDFIDRNQLYHDMTMKRLELHEKGLSWNEFCRGFGFAMEFVKQAPSAEPERTAKVTLLTSDSKGYWSTNGRCQGCGFLLERKHAYCPNCGDRL